MEELVIIIGGGPAGAAAGCYLSKEGIPNLILEWRQLSKLKLEVKKTILNQL